MIADKSESTSPATDGLPLTTANRITKIASVSDGRIGGKKKDFQFNVTVSDGRNEFTARVEGKDLVTAGRFRQCMLTRFGVWFSDERYERRGGAREWSGDIEILMQRKSA